MMKDIKFCSCSSFESDGDNLNQCMLFSFTDRALKMLSEGVLKQITDTDLTGNTATGIYAGLDENGDEKYVKLHKLDENRWRISTKYIDHLIRLLFNYLPAYYISPEEKERQHCGK